MVLPCADLLDYTRNTFDRDFLEFNVNVAELETALQGFINASFENITSTEHALNLLKQFEAILQRETLKSDLDSKYIVIFHNYGLDLETVQKIYDKQVWYAVVYKLGGSANSRSDNLSCCAETGAADHPQRAARRREHSVVQASPEEDRGADAEVQK